MDERFRPEGKEALGFNLVLIGATSMHCVGWGHGGNDCGNHVVLICSVEYFVVPVLNGEYLGMEGIVCNNADCLDGALGLAVRGRAAGNVNVVTVPCCRKGWTEPR
jgi:hypothetical protein